LEYVLEITWKGINLSRQSINNILKKRRRNGSPYGRSKKDWKYFRTESPDELWQMDVRGPFRIENKQYYALVIIDNHSRYVICCNLCEHIRTEKVIQTLTECFKMYGKPKI